MGGMLQRLTGVAGTRPVLVLVTVLLVTVGLASRIPEGELTNDTSAFSPTTPEVVAAEELQDRFSDSATAPLQVVVTGDDVVGADGVATVETIERVAVATFGDALVGDERGVTSFLTPARAVAEQQGVELATLDDAQVDELQRAAIDGPPVGAAPADAPPGQQPDAPPGQQPGEPQAGPAERAEGQRPGQPSGEQPPGTPGGGGVADLAAALVGGDDPTTAGSGLVLLQLDRGAFEDAGALVDAQVDFVAALDEAGTPLQAVPFSGELLSAPDDDFQREVGQLFGLALGVILVVLAAVLRARRGTRLGWLGAVRRSAADMAAAAGTVVVAVVWTQGLQVVLGPTYLGVVGEPTPPTQIVPILLLALGVDYAIHLTSRYREELAAGERDPVAATRSLGPTVGMALLLSMVTTAVGFLTNLFSPIPAIRDLGVLAATGILVTFLLCLTLLPAIRSLLDRRPAARGALVVDEVAPSERSVFARLALVGLRPALRAPAAMVAAAVTLSGVGAYGLTQLDTEFDVTAFLPEDSPYVDALATLADDFGGGLAEVTEVLVTGDVLTPAAHNAHADVPATLADVDGVVQLGGRADVTTPVTAMAGLAAADAAQGAALAGARAAGLRDDGTVAEGTDVAAMYDALGAAFPSVAAVVDVDDPDGPATRVAVRTQSEAAGVAEVAAAVAAAVAPLEDVGATTVVTSEAIVTDGVLQALSSSQVQGLLLTVVVVLLLLGLVYLVRSRQPGLGMLVMAPVVAVVLWVFGLMAATGIPFDPITAVVSALVVGLGVDFCIHLGERFREDLDAESGDVPAALRASLQHTGAALAGSAATTMFGFSVLATASIVPFQRLGVVTIYAVGLSLLATLFVLPSILVLYGRRQSGLAVDAHGEAGPADQRERVGAG